MSVLDERIRRIAREEAANGGVASAVNMDPLAELEGRLDALIARVDELEKTAATRAASKRTTRKTTPAEPSEETAESSE